MGHGGMRGRDKREGGGSGADREKGDRGRERTSCDGDLPGRAINRVETLKDSEAADQRQPQQLN